jgi:hypothetical protein
MTTFNREDYILELELELMELEQGYHIICENRANTKRNTLAWNQLNELARLRSHTIRILKDSIETNKRLL